MPRLSAGLLMYRIKDGGIEVLLAHPGGPYFVKKDEGAWSIPKGEYDPGESPLEAARREFQEETGFQASGEFLPLTSRKQPGGKIISAWAMEGDCDPSAIRSNTFSMEWPPRSGKQQEFLEVDRAGWFPIPAAREKIVKGQAPFLDELSEILKKKS